MQLGPINMARERTLAAGKVKVAARREAWQVLPAGEGELKDRVEKSAYLGSSFEYTFATELGAIFVVAPDLARPWQPGDVVSLRLAGHGLSVVAA